MLSSLQYALYNITVIPIVLYVAHNFDSRREAIGAGGIAAAMVIILAVVLQVAFSGAGEAVANAPIPLFTMMRACSMEYSAIAFIVMLLGTLIETEAGLLQRINERIDGQLSDRQRKPLSKWGRTAVAILFLSAASMLAAVGIIALTAKGYGTTAWVFFVIYLSPLVTAGIWKLNRHAF